MPGGKFGGSRRLGDTISKVIKPDDSCRLASTLPKCRQNTGSPYKQDAQASGNGSKSRVTAQRTSKNKENLSGAQESSKKKTKEQFLTGTTGIKSDTKKQNSQSSIPSAGFNSPITLPEESISQSDTRKNTRTDNTTRAQEVDQVDSGICLDSKNNTMSTRDLLNSKMRNAENSSNLSKVNTSGTYTINSYSEDFESYRSDIANLQDFEEEEIPEKIEFDREMTAQDMISRNSKQHIVNLSFKKNDGMYTS